MGIFVKIGTPKTHGLLEISTIALGPVMPLEPKRFHHVSTEVGSAAGHSLGRLADLVGRGSWWLAIEEFYTEIEKWKPKHGDFQCENLIPHHFLGNFRLVFVAVDSQYMESRRNEGLPPSAKVFLLPKMGTTAFLWGMELSIHVVQPIR